MANLNVIETPNDEISHDRSLGSLSAAPEEGEHIAVLKQRIEKETADPSVSGKLNELREQCRAILNILDDRDMGFGAIDWDQDTQFSEGAKRQRDDRDPTQALLWDLHARLAEIDRKLIFIRPSWFFVFGVTWVALAVGVLLPELSWRHIVLAPFN